MPSICIVLHHCQQTVFFDSLDESPALFISDVLEARRGQVHLVVVRLFIFSITLFFRRTENLFGALRYRFLQVTGTAYRGTGQKLNMCDFVASSQAFDRKACDHWCPYIARHGVPLCVLPTHVWKPGFRQKNYHFHMQQLSEKTLNAFFLYRANENIAMLENNVK